MGRVLRFLPEIGVKRRGFQTNLFLFFLWRALVMAYDYQVKFMEDFKKIYSDWDKTWEIAWRVYNNARKNPNQFCLMGRLSDRNTIIGPKEVQKEEQAGNYMILLGDDKAENFFVTNDKQRGNVLNIDAWSCGVNDAWVLGGIHSDGNISSTFNFFYKEEFKKASIDSFVANVLYSEKHGTTVTAREILGLISAHYQAYILFGALIFKPTTATAKSDLTLTQYKGTIENYKGKNGIELIKKCLSSAVEA
jgi:hypothetical protein